MSTTSNNPTTQTATTPARFTKEEKSILYELFHQNEDIIDIKYRRNSARKNCSVRDTWDRIAELYNNHPDTLTVRNVKQIQKFWLNARLRKHYPITIYNNKPTTKKSSLIIKKIESVDVIDNNIKFEKLCDDDDDDDDNEEIEMIQQENDDDDGNNNMQQHEVEISTSSNDVLLDNTTSSTTHQYNIDHISADKLTLNDLLEFKNARTTRPGDEIVLQIKTQPDTLTTTTTHQHHQHQKDNTNTIIGINNNQQQNNSSIQAYTTTSYRISNPTTILSEQQYQTQPLIQQHQIVQQQPQQQQQPPLPHLHHKSTPITTSQQGGICCSHNNNNSNNTSITSIASSTTTIDNNIDDKINFYRMKEAEFKYKDEQLKMEKTKIELQQAKESLKHMKELHIYKIEEMKLKLKLLNAEEKKITTLNGNNLPFVTVKKL